MPSIRDGLLIALGLISVGFAVLWGLRLRDDSRAAPRRPSDEVRRPTASELGIGFLTDFLDTLGIGSFAVTTALFKLLRLAPDEDIPGTLNVGHSIPTFLEAFIFISIVAIEGRTLMLMILASVAGAWIGAGTVASWPRRKIQIGMGVALLAAAAFFLMKNLGWFPPGGDALGLSGPLLAAGLIGNFIFGALMTLGIGAYAPSMILVSLLGMNPVAAFPIMMGSCAFLMPTASIHFIRQRRYAVAPSLGLTLGGAPAVLIAAYVVKSLPMTALRWLVIVVVLYTAATMLRSAWTESAAPGQKTS
ncbi:MAG: TSUP family transporter [Elusimicrobiota bacterium]